MRLSPGGAVVDSEPESEGKDAAEAGAGGLR